MRGLAVTLVAFVAAASPAAADLRTPLTAEVAFIDAEGAVLERIAPGTAFTIRLVLKSAVGAPLPRDMRPMGWLRPVEPDALTCAQSAAAYRASGFAPTGSVDLNRRMLGVITEDDVLTVVDPEMNLASANIAAAERLPGRATDMAADAAGGRFLVALPGLGQVWSQPAIGDGAGRPAGVPAPAMVLTGAGAGPVVIGDRAAVQGDRIWPDAMGAAIAPDRALALRFADRIEVIGPDGAPLFTTPATKPADIALGDQVLVWTESGTLRLSWRDAPQDPPATIPLPEGMTRIALAPSGRYALTYGPGAAGAALIDLARGREIQRIGAHAPVAEIAFADDTAYLRPTDQSVIGIIDLRLAGGAEPAPIGQIALGPPQPPDDPGAPRRLLVPLTPAEPALLAIHTGNATAFRLNRTQATTNMPPMGAIPLRGGVPRLAVGLDRGLRETAPGVFQVAAALPGPGEYELVVSSGLGQAAFCAMLPVLPADPGTTPPQPAQLAAVPGPDGRLRLRLTDAADRPVAQAQGRLRLSALTGNWRGAADFTTDAQGLTQPLSLPDLRPLVVMTDLPGQPVAPLLLEDRS